MPNPTFQVGDRILCRAVFQGDHGQMSLGAYPLTWDCPQGAAIPDPTLYTNNTSYDQTMVFIAIQPGLDVTLRFRKVGSPTAWVGSIISITPLPAILAQGVVVEGLAP